MEIGEIINIGLKRQNMDRKELAKAMEVNQSAVAKWISGRTKPPAEKLIKIIRILDLYYDFFPEKKMLTAEDVVEDMKEGKGLFYSTFNSTVKMAEQMLEIKELKERMSELEKIIKQQQST